MELETLRCLHHKLRIMGAPISGPSFIYGDNVSVIYNTQQPESCQKKQSNSIYYHAVQESVVRGESLTSHFSIKNNWTDLLTKVTYGQPRRYLVSEVMYEIYI